MLPSPATTFWSDSAALSEVFLRLHARASIAASNSLPSGSGPSARSKGSRSSSARVVEGDARARRHVKHDVVVGGVLRALVVVAPRCGFSAAPGDAKRSRHAEVHHQHVAGGKVGQQIFGAAAEPLDPL